MGGRGSWLRGMSGGMLHWWRDATRQVTGSMKFRRRELPHVWSSSTAAPSLRMRG